MIRALFEWIVDNGLTPYLLVNELSDNLMVPQGIANDNKIILNLSPSATRDLDMTNEAVMFSARFLGKPENLYIPTHAVLAIYANENGEGMMFPKEVVSEITEVIDSVKPQQQEGKKKSVKKAQKPILTVVK